MTQLESKLLEQVKRLEKNGNGESAEVVDQVSTELVPSVDGKDAIDANLESLCVPQFAITLQEAEQRIQLLQEFVKRYMTPNQDYGMIPGCQKPSLFKPGAEKLCDVYGLSKHVEVLDKVEDWEKPFLAYEVRVTLVNKRTSHVESQGIGTANSKEKKFARQDTFTIANTLLKIAKKRALVDAVLSATRSSGLFTQDFEDLVGAGMEPQRSETVPAQEPAKEKVGKEAQGLSKDGDGPAAENQLQQIYNLAHDLEITSQQAKQIMKLHYRKDDSRKLSKVQADDLIRRLTEQKMREALTQ